MKDISAFYAEAQHLVEAVEAFITEHKLGDRVKADHICYKCEDEETFLRIRNLFDARLEKDAAAKRINQPYIAGRRIALITLARPIPTSVGMIGMLELSDQKPEGGQVNGFEHIELYATQGTYDELVAHLERRGVKTKKVVRPHHTTHDIAIPGGFLIRLTRESLYDVGARDVAVEKV